MCMTFAATAGAMYDICSNDVLHMCISRAFPSPPAAIIGMHHWSAPGRPENDAESAGVLVSVWMHMDTGFMSILGNMCEKSSDLHTWVSRMEAPETAWMCFVTDSSLSVSSRTSSTLLSRALRVESRSPPVARPRKDMVGDPAVLLGGLITRQIK
jgi:hypothetical protein